MYWWHRWFIQQWVAPMAMAGYRTIVGNIILYQRLVRI